MWDSDMAMMGWVLGNAGWVGVLDLDVGYGQDGLGVG